MATQLQRACIQAARSVAISRRQCAARQATRSTRQWNDIRGSAPAQEMRQCRTFSQNHRCLAQAEETDSYEVSEEDEILMDIVEEEIEELDESQLSSTAHAELEQHREVREMSRIAAWEMPLLTELAKPFEKPNFVKSPLCWRYTSHFGDPHPADRKVVVEFKVSHLGLSKEAGLKLKKLAGPRYNPTTDRVRMSCDSYETQARNKRYLGDTIQQLIAEAKDPKTDSFTDLPLDLRHHKPPTVFKFPEEWKSKRPAGRLGRKTQREHLYDAFRHPVPSVSGLAAIESDIEAREKKAAEEPVMVVGRRDAKGGAAKRGPGRAAPR